MILSAMAAKLKRRSKDDFKGRHFGVAPVTKRPGKSRIVLMRQAADVRLRNAVYH